MKTICYKSNNNRISLTSDDVKFYINITAGHAETFVSVGYSTPNYADWESLKDSHSFVTECLKSLDHMVEIDLDEMLVIMYKKVERNKSNIQRTSTSRN